MIMKRQDRHSAGESFANTNYNSNNNEQVIRPSAKRHLTGKMRNQSLSVISEKGLFFIKQSF